MKVPQLRINIPHINNNPNSNNLKSIEDSTKTLRNQSLLFITRLNLRTPAQPSTLPAYIQKHHGPGATELNETNLTQRQYAEHTNKFIINQPQISYK